jgi:hypothetical protein
VAADTSWLLCNMAERQVMQLNHALCFLFSKLHKCDENHIKMSLLDYYSPADIHAAKELFMNVVSTFKDIIAVTKVRERRGDGRAENEVNDIFSIIKELDEKQTLSNLPIFVSDSVDKMPSSAVVDGDLRAIMNRFTKVESQISYLQNSVKKLCSGTSAIVSAPSCQQAQAKGLVSDLNIAGSSKSTTQSECLQPSRVWADEYTTGSSSCDDIGGQYAADDEWQVQRKTKRRRTHTNQQPTAVGSLPDKLRFAVVSTPLSEKFLSHSEPSNSVKQFNQPIVLSNNRPTAQQSVATTRANNYAGAVTKPVDPRTQQKLKQRSQLKPKQGPIVIGRSRSNLSKEGQTGQRSMISAARPFISKATFCVDNVSTDVSELDLANFVTAMDIDVLGCYKVKPRRTHWQRLNGVVPSDRLTFRLCIPREDSDRLLNPKLWPAHISISWWSFKKKNPESAEMNTGTNSLGNNASTSNNSKLDASSLAVNNNDGVTVRSSPSRTVYSSGVGTPENMDVTIICNHGSDE